MNGIAIAAAISLMSVPLAASGSDPLGRERSLS